jgi:hypothetical protein
MELKKTHIIMRGDIILSPIPNFFDKYHLPAGEHLCSYAEVENKFVSNDQRKKVWNDFMRLYDRFTSLGLNPKSMLIDGSFVTGRQQPGDVDFGALIPPRITKEALGKVTDPHDKAAVNMFSNSSSSLNQEMIRNLFGAHMLVAPNEMGLKLISKLFRTGGAQFGKLRDPDPIRDPAWVTVPKEKGILRINFY